MHLGVRSDPPSKFQEGEIKTTERSTLKRGRLGMWNPGVGDIFCSSREVTRGEDLA